MKHFEQALVLWDLLGDIPVDDDSVIQIPFIHFPVGTHSEDIWLWFEETFDGFYAGDVMDGRYTRGN